MTRLKRFIISFLGLNEKTQQKKTEAVAVYVHSKKKLYAREMTRIQSQARKVHKKTLQAHEQSVVLSDLVDDIAAKIAVVTSRPR